MRALKPGAKLCLALAVVVTSVVVVPQAAVAERSVDAARYSPVFGPRLAGAALVWAKGRADGGYVLERFAGGETSRLREARNRRPDSALELQLSASPFTLLVGVNRVFDLPGPGGPLDPTPEDLGASALDREGRVSRLGPACGDSSACEDRSVDVDGSVVAHLGDPDPRGDDDVVVVRDLARPDSQPLRVEGAGGEVRVAGRYVAWLGPAAAVVVYDREERRVTYRIDTGSFVRSFDLQSDGTVVIVRESLPSEEPGQVRLWWASPSEPFAHRVPVPARSDYQVKLADGLIVYESRARARSLAGSRLGATYLRGPNKTLVRPVGAYFGDERFDFDGETVAWLDRRCRRFVVRAAPLRALWAQPRLENRAPCRLNLTSSRASVSSSGQFTVRPDCATFARNCSLSRLNVTGSRTRGLARVQRTLPRRRGIRLRLTRRGRKVFGDKAVLRVKIYADVADDDLTERRKAPLTLRRVP